VFGDIATGQRIEFRHQSARTSGVRYSRPVMEGPEARPFQVGRGRNFRDGSTRFRGRGLAKVREVEPGDGTGEVEGSGQNGVHLDGRRVEHPPRGLSA